MFTRLLTIPSFIDRMKDMLQTSNETGQFDFEKWYGCNGEILMHRQGYVASAEREEDGRMFEWMRFPQDEVATTIQWIAGYRDNGTDHIAAANALVFEQDKRGMHDMAALANLHVRGYRFDTLSVELRTVQYDDLDRANPDHWLCAHLVGFPTKQAMIEFATAVKGLTALEVLQ